MTYLGPPRESGVEDRLAGLAPPLLGWVRFWSSFPLVSSVIESCRPLVTDPQYLINQNRKEIPPGLSVCPSSACLPVCVYMKLQDI